jgi:hypothetical protein
MAEIASKILTGLRARRDLFGPGISLLPQFKGHCVRENCWSACRAPETKRVCGPSGGGTSVMKHVNDYMQPLMCGLGLVCVQLLPSVALAADLTAREVTLQFHKAPRPTSTELICRLPISKALILLALNLTAPLSCKPIFPVPILKARP